MDSRFEIIRENSRRPPAALLWLEYRLANGSFRLSRNFLPLRAPSRDPSVGSEAIKVRPITVRGPQSRSTSDSIAAVWRRRRPRPRLRPSPLASAYAPSRYGRLRRKFRERSSGGDRFMSSMHRLNDDKRRVLFRWKFRLDRASLPLGEQEGEDESFSSVPKCVSLFPKIRVIPSCESLSCKLRCPIEH